MAYKTVLSNIPAKITAGTSVSWLISLPSFPATEGWTLTYTLVSLSVQVQVTSTPSGDDHLFEIPFSESSDYIPGKYAFQTHAANATERYQVDAGEVEIEADFAGSTTGVDTRDWLTVAIEALQASIAGRASKTQMVQLVAGVQIQHMTLADQISALERLKSMRAAKVGRWHKTIRSRFKN